MMAFDDPGLPRLVVVGPERLAGLVLALAPPEVVIGHSDTADVVLEDVFVSRRHALVTIDDAGVVTLSDLKSTGGTFVNKVLIDRPCVLRAGDLVRFADLVARFEPGISSAAAIAAHDAPTLIRSPSISTETLPAADTPATKVVRGTVCDAGGEPVPGTAVVLVTRNIDAQEQLELATAAPDEIGYYELEWDPGARLARLELRVLDGEGRQVAVVELSEGAQERERVDIVVAVSEQAPGAPPADPDAGPVPSSDPADPPSDDEYLVSGEITWADGSPVVGVAVRAVDQGLRGEQPLGPHAPAFTTETRTDASGAYEIRYWRAQLARPENATADLIVRALDRTGIVVAASPTMPNAPVRSVINLTLSGAVTGQPSEYERLVARLTPSLAGLTPPDVSSLLPADLEFLAGKTHADRARIGDLLNAAVLYRDAVSAAHHNKARADPYASAAGSASMEDTDGSLVAPEVLVPAFYGLIREGVPPEWGALLGSGADSIQTGLKAAVTDGFAPDALRDKAAAIARVVVSTGLQQILAPGAAGDSTVLASLLAAAKLSAEQQQTLVSAAWGAGGSAEEFWSGLATIPEFVDDPTALQRIQLALQLAVLTGSNAALVGRLMSEGSVTSPSDLVAMDRDAWVKLLAGTPGDEVIVPPGVPGDTVDEQRQNYASSIVDALRSALPTEAIGHLVATGVVTTAPEARAGIADFLAEAMRSGTPSFDIRTTQIKRYVADNGLAVHPDTVAELQRIQRAFQISISAESMSTMLNLGLDAAHVVAAIPQQSFIDRFAEALGGVDDAASIYQRATFMNARNLGLLLQLNDVVNGVTPAAIAGGTSTGRGTGAPAVATPKQQILDKFPDYEELFGALDACECDECTSVLSPAAYFVEMLQFLKGSTPNDYLPAGSPAPASGPSPRNAKGNTPLDVLIGGGSGISKGTALLGRRPDLAYLKLTCENTNTELPYIDLVNEVMESFILYNGPRPFAAHDTGDTTSVQLDASPQYTLDGPRYGIGGPPPAPETSPDPAPSAAAPTSAGPYLRLATACYPFTLPFNEPIAVARTYLDWLQSSRNAVLATFQTDPASASAAVDAELLELDPYLFELLTGTTLDRQAAKSLPTGGALFGSPPAPAGQDWRAAVAWVPTFLQVTGIAAGDLIALLQTRFANPSFPRGPDRAFFEALPLDYPELLALVSDGFAPPAPGSAVALQLGAAGITDINGWCAAAKAWYQRNPDVGRTLVIFSPGGGCELREAWIAELDAIPTSPVSAPVAPSASLTDPPPDPIAPPAAIEFARMQAFVRLWRALGWSVADVDRALLALDVITVASPAGDSVSIPAAAISALARVQHLQALLGPSPLQALFALWGELDPDGDDSLYAQMFVDPAAVPNDPAFAPVADGAVLQDPAQTISGHLGGLLAALQISAGDLALIRSDAGLADPVPSPGDGIWGAGLTSPFTVATVAAGSAGFVITTSPAAPPGTSGPVMGGPAGTWVGAATAPASDPRQISVSVSSGPAPEPGDLVVGAGLTGPVNVIDVAGAGPYTLTTRQRMPIGTVGTLVGGPRGVWVATAAPGPGPDELTLSVAEWPLTLANVTELYRYSEIAALLGIRVREFLALKSLAGTALDPFIAPDTAAEFVAVVQQVQQSNFTVSQLAYLYQGVSAPPTGLAPQQATVELLAWSLRDGLQQIASDCAVVPDPKGTLTASTVTQLIDKATATETVALINGTATFTVPLSTPATLTDVAAWTATGAPSGGQISLTLTNGSVPRAGDVISIGGVPQPHPITSVTITEYALTTAEPVLPATGEPLAGGAGDVWIGAAVPTVAGGDQLTLTLEAGPPPQTGEVIVAHGLAQPLTITAVTPTATVYMLTVSGTIGAWTGGDLAGGSGSVWLGTFASGTPGSLKVTPVAGSTPQPGDTISAAGLAQPCTVTTCTIAACVITTSPPVAITAGAPVAGGSIARLDSTGVLLGIDATRTPNEVGAKLSYDPATQTLGYLGAMTDQERTVLLALSGGADWQKAINYLHSQPATFLRDSFAGLLTPDTSQPNPAQAALQAAENALLFTVPSLDGSLNATHVTALGILEADPGKADTTAIAWKFEYLLRQLLPDLQQTLSHALVKQTITDTFTLDPQLTSALLETILGSTAATGAVIDDFLALGTTGASARFYTSVDLSGPPISTGTVAADAFAVTIPAGSLSASFGTWLATTSSSTYALTVVTTGGAPHMYIGDPSAAVELAPSAPGVYDLAASGGGHTYLRLELTNLPAAGATVTVSWQSPGLQPPAGQSGAVTGVSIAKATIPGAALLPDVAYQALSHAYVRVQKAAIVADGFALNASEVEYLTSAGSWKTAPATVPPISLPVFGGFDLNALPLEIGVTTAAQATGLFGVWRRLAAYTTLRDGLPAGAVTLIDVFSAATFGGAVDRIPQATGWPAPIVSDLVGRFYAGFAATDPNPVIDEVVLAKMRACADVVFQTGASAAQLFNWARYSWPDVPPTDPHETAFVGLRAIAQDVQNVVASNYDAASWPAVAERLNDPLRGQRRDALVSYVVGWLGNNSPKITDADSLFELLLLDPQMGTCMKTSRLALAITSVQLFVQRCLLGLETAANSPGGVLKPPAASAADWGKAINVDPQQIDATTWQTWMGTYSLRTANIEAFLWPENSPLVYLRDDQSEPFDAFASSLQQGPITDGSVTDGLISYLQGLDQVKRLDIRAVLTEPADASVPGSVPKLHVIGRTWHDPLAYFYRQLIGDPGAITRRWTPWRKLDVDIQGDIVDLVIWEGRLRVIWPVFTEQSYTPPAADQLTGTKDPTTGNYTVNTGPPAQKYWHITLAWSEYYQGAWQPKKVTQERLTSVWSPERPPKPPKDWKQLTGWGEAKWYWQDPSNPYQGPAQQVIDRHVLVARVDNNGDLVAEIYVELSWLGFDVADTGNVWLARSDLDKSALLLGEFRFSACGDSLHIGYTYLGVPDPIDLPFPWPPIPSSRLLLTKDMRPYNNGLRSTPGEMPPLQLQSGGVFDPTTGGLEDDPWPFDQLTDPALTKLTYLRNTPYPSFHLRVPRRHRQFVLQEPFFYQDSERTFFVAPRRAPLRDTVAHPSTITPAVLSGLVSIPRDPAAPAAAYTWSEQYATSTNWLAGSYVGRHAVPPAGLIFETHSHPYVCDLIEALVGAQGQSQSGAISGLLNLANQNRANGFDFKTLYDPDPTHVGDPPPTETIDFSLMGSYAGYNWELFCWAPTLAALTLTQNGLYEDADRMWRHLLDLTNPTTSTASPLPYWQVQPFTKAIPQTLLQLMSAIDDPTDPAHADAVAQVTAWYWHPFDPYTVARARIGAIEKYLFMAEMDTYLAWADALFGQIDTRESISQATEILIMVSHALGKLPETLPSAKAKVEYDYDTIQGRLDAFGNFAEMLENQFPFAGPVPSDPQSHAPGLLGLTKTLFFCIPQNPKLLQYWATVADRLYKIRHCLNIHGIAQELALFEPPANLLDLIEARAEGLDPSSVLADLSAPLPNYRFTHLIRKASELASMSQALGRQLLEALEKNDAEALALLHATQESAVLALMKTTKEDQVKDAQGNVDALNASRAIAVSRYGFFQMMLGKSAAEVTTVGVTIALETVLSEPTTSTGGVQLLPEEANELDKSDDAAALHRDAGELETLASLAALLPLIELGTHATPWGVGVKNAVTWGGPHVAASGEAVVKGMKTLADYLTYKAVAAGKMGGYVRRQQEWAHQSNQAAGEIMQIDQQILAAQIRVTIAEDELKVQQQQIDNAGKVEDFLKGKFTRQQLYGWMSGQISTLHSQLYQLAFRAAKMSETAFQRELGIRDSNYITYGAWDGPRKGLLAGERLQLAVQQLESAYLDQNQREFEITRHVSLLLHDPGALIALKTTGECDVELPEQMYDADYPGHYRRRLRDISLTIPCVAGPYTSINCTLTLVSSKIRVDPTTATGGGATGYVEKPIGQDPRFIYHFGATAAIATSHAQNDSGVFAVNFTDERYLPVETYGAICRLHLSMPPECNTFDTDTVSDVVFSVRYTAGPGGDLMRSQAYTAAMLPPPSQQTAAPRFGPAPKQTRRERLFSLRHEFPSEWATLLDPPNPAAPFAQIPLGLLQDRFPFQYRGRKLQVTGVQILALPRDGANLQALPVKPWLYLDDGGAPPVHVGAALKPPATPSNAVAWTHDTMYGTRAATGTATPESTQLPRVWWISAPQAALTTLGDTVQDLLLLVEYKVS